MPAMSAIEVGNAGYAGSEAPSMVSGEGDASVAAAPLGRGDGVGDGGAGVQAVRRAGRSKATAAAVVGPTFA